MLKRICFIYLCLHIINLWSKPNIVIIIADDLGWGDVGFHGGKAKTPALDKLAKDGIELSRFYVYPTCTPTRVGLLTGKSPLKFGVSRPVGPRQVAIPLKEELLSGTLQKNGYQTWLVGKWHVGESTVDYLPMKRGFDHSYGCFGGGVDYFKHTEFKSKNLDWHRNGKAIKEEGYSTDLFTKEAVKMIKNRKRDKPFFLMMAYTAAHVPLQAPEETKRKYVGTDEEKTYLAMIDHLDQGVAKIIKTIEAEKIDKDTVVIFFSDNGHSTRGPGKSGILSGGKGGLNEGGIRSTALIHWKGTLESGKLSIQMSILDLFPTLCEISKINAKENLEGQNYLSALKENKKLKVKPYIFSNGRFHTIIQDDYKLLGNRRHGWSLYNVSEDPSEKNDLIDSKKELADDLKKVYESYMKTVPEVTLPNKNRRQGEGRNQNRREIK